MDSLSAAPPTEFKRMLSWQLSQPRAVPAKKKKRKAEKRIKLGWEGEGSEEPDAGGGSGCGQDAWDTLIASDEELDNFAYFVVNSEGEEEAYYSAPESPLSSEDETTCESYFDDAATSVSGWSVHSGVSGTTVTDLPEQVRKPGGRSKKHKKKAKYLAKLAQAEFFQPLCDLVENKLSIEVGRLEVCSHAEVPSLVELTIKKIQRKALVQQDTADLPFLIHSLLGHDRELRSAVSTHVRWLERLLAAYETECHQMKENGQLDGEKGRGLAYSPCELWPEHVPLNEFPGVWEGLHCPLPEPYYPRCSNYPYVKREHRVRPLLHFANYLFPSSTAKGKAGEYSGSAPLSPAQVAAVSYVNGFVKTRYKELTTEYPEFLKLWPAYVYWARGQLKLAADAFVAAISSLERPIDQAIALNELGRMFLQFGDRTTACRFFRKSTELPADIQVPNNDSYSFSDKLEQPCAFAMRAAAWDCCWLDTSTARAAARSWDLVLKEGHEVPSGIWYLHMAACESRMFVHAGRAVSMDVSSPTGGASPDFNHTLQWLQECEQLISSHTSRYPILHYHTSLLHAMMKRAGTSSREFRNFENGYSGFREWVDSILPGQLFSSNLPRYQQPTPWQPLLDMLTQQCLDHAPVMPLQWRLRLLHPKYPYVRSDRLSYLADHGAPDVGLRLNDKGQLTADIHLDTPPLRCVIVDPYTGSLIFSRKASLKHYSTCMYGSSPELDPCVLPWPMRVVETEDYVVELMLTSTSDMELTQPTEANYGAVLHRYHAEGTHHRVDLRRAIRKQLRQTVLDLAEDKGLEGKEGLLDKLLEFGYYVDISSLNGTEPKPKYSRTTKTVGKGKAKKNTVIHRKCRNNQVSEFSLRLSHHMVYGEGTLMLLFYLNPRPTDRHRSGSVYWGQVLVFVNCTTSETFLKPRVYCVGDTNGFGNLYPNPKTTSLYQNRHHKHVKYAIAGRSEAAADPADDHRQLVFDENGDVVYQKSLRLFLGASIMKARHKNDIEPSEMKATSSLGHRVFTSHKTTNPPTLEVCSFSPRLEDAADDMEELVSAPFRVQGVTSVVPVPGVIFVHTTEGLCLLHPGNLEPLKILGLQDKDAGQGSSSGGDDQNPQIQLKGLETFFNLVKVYDVESCLEGEEEVEGSQREEGVGQVGSPERESSSVSQYSVVQEAIAEEEGGESGEVEEEEVGLKDRPDGNVHVGGMEEEEEEKEKKRRREYFGACDYGSCRVAFTVNNRLIILHVPHWAKSVKVELDVRLPGKVTELHAMGKFGYMLSVTQFPDQFREEVYWLSETGRLLGMLPCLGAGPRSFTSATLPPRLKAPVSPTTGGEGGKEEEEEGGLYVFFNDGQGGISCVRPSVD